MTTTDTDTVLPYERVTVRDAQLTLGTTVAFAGSIGRVREIERAGAQTTLHLRHSHGTATLIVQDDDVLTVWRT